MKFSIAAYGLPEREVKLFQTIVRLSDQLNGAWIFSETAVCDVLLADGQMVDQAEANGCRCRHLIRVVRQDEPGKNDVLVRPIHAERFIRQLLFFDSLLRRKSVPDQAERESRRGRLARWPSASVLRSDKMRVRMATLLLRAEFDVAALCEHAGVSYQACSDFMDELRDKGYLIESASQTPGSGAVLGVAAGFRNLVRSGLIASLRRCLGLSGAADD